MPARKKTSSVRIGVIGTSTFTQRFHLDSLKDHPGARVTAICGRNRERAQQVAASYGIPNVLTDYRKLVACPEVDAVIVVTPNNTHYPMALATIKARKHLFCEKPLGMNLAEAREMYEKAETAGIVHMTNFTNRGLPAAIRMKGLLDEGYVGKPYHLSISVLTSLHRAGTMPWRRDKKQAGTGALGDIGSHMVDLAQWFMGDIKRVAAHLSTAVNVLRDPETGKFVRNETDDTCAMVVEFANGVQGMIHVSWVAHPGVGGARLRAEVHGSKGMLCIERTRGVGDPEAWVTVRGAQGDRTKLEPLFVPYFLVKDLDLSSEDALISALNRQPFYAACRFVEAVLGNREPSPSLYDGAKCQAVLDAAVKSSETGRWVAVAQI